MIANEIAFGESFQANIHYNQFGNKAEPNPHKCAWHVARNLFTDDLEVAGKLMEATASASRASKPSYHFSIDWDRSEERFLSQEKCIEAADKVLEGIGLSEHQALYFWHVDANHPHMHVVVNRVNEHTGKAWDMWKSKERLERATHEVAKEMEFLQVPGKHNELEYLPDKDREATRSRAERATEPELKPWAAEKVPDIKAEIGNAFYHAESWQDLSATLGEAGYEIRAKGQGYIITDGHNYTQLSKMGKHIRMDALEEKFGEKFIEFENEQALKPKREVSPVESFENLPEAIEEELKQQVEAWDDLPEAEGTSLDTRVTELMAVMSSLEQFEKGFQSHRSARAVLAAEGKAERLKGYLARAENLLSYHEQKSMELLFAVDERSLDKEENIPNKLRSAIQHVQAERQKNPKLKRLMSALKKKKQRQAEARAKEKQANKLEWNLYYRLQKIREAQGRITTRKLELAEQEAKFAALRKAHLQNTSTQEHLSERQKELIRSLPKGAITGAAVPWETKRKMFAIWFAEHGHTAQFLKEKSRGRDTERDPFDD